VKWEDWWQPGSTTANALFTTTTTNDSVYGAVIMARPLWEFTRFMWWMQTEHQLAANPQTKPTDLGCESACHHLHPPSPFIIIPHFTVPQRVEGWVDLTGYRPRWFTHLQTVTHPSVNRARRSATVLINALPLSHATVPQHQLTAVEKCWSYGEYRWLPQIEYDSTGITRWLTF